jgi:hypothetical protein
MKTSGSAINATVVVEPRTPSSTCDAVATTPISVDRDYDIAFAEYSVTCSVRTKTEQPRQCPRDDDDDVVDCRDYATAEAEYQAVRAAAMACVRTANKQTTSLPLTDCAGDRNYTLAAVEYAVVSAMTRGARTTFDGADGCNDRDYATAAAEYAAVAASCTDASNDRNYCSAEAELASLCRRRPFAAVVAQDVDACNDRAYDRAADEIKSMRIKLSHAATKAAAVAVDDAPLDRDYNSAAMDLAWVRAVSAMRSNATTFDTLSSPAPVTTERPTPLGTEVISSSLCVATAPPPSASPAPSDSTDWSNDRPYIVTSALRESKKVVMTTPTM